MNTPYIMPDYNALMRSLRQQQTSTAEAQLLGMDYDEADARANFEIKPANQSPLGAIAMALTREQGKRDRTTARSGLDKALKQAASATGNIKGEELRQALEAERIRQENLRVSQGQLGVSQGNLNLNRAKFDLSKSEPLEPEVQEWNLKEGAPEGLVPLRTWSIRDTEGGPPILVNADNGQQIPEDVLQYYEKPKTGYQGVGGGVKMNQSMLTGLQAGEQQLVELRGLRDKARQTPGSLKALDVPTEKINDWIRSGTSNNILDFVDADKWSNWSEEEQRAVNEWYANWEWIFTLPERHAKFGATLTAPEKASFQEAQALFRSGDYEAAMRRVDELVRIADISMARKYNDLIELGRDDQVRGWAQGKADALYGAEGSLINLESLDPWSSDYGGVAAREGEMDGWTKAERKIYDGKKDKKDKAMYLQFLREKYGVADL